MGSWSFAPNSKQVRTHPVRTHMDSTSNQVLKICLAITEQTIQHCGLSEIKLNPLRKSEISEKLFLKFVVDGRDY